MSTRKNSRVELPSGQLQTIVVVKSSERRVEPDSSFMSSLGYGYWHFSFLGLLVELRSWFGNKYALFVMPHKPNRYGSKTCCQRTWAYPKPEARMIINRIL